MAKKTLRKDIINEHSYNHVFQRDDGSIGIETINNEPSLTQQQYKDETDINNIMAKYAQRPDPSIFERTGKGFYGDFSKSEDFHSSLNKVIAAEDAFMTLDAKIRHRFNNDPGQLLSFLNDSKNNEEAIKLGIINPPKPNINEQKTNTNEQKTNPQ